jgi:hypothetical protein
MIPEDDDAVHLTIDGANNCVCAQSINKPGICSKDDTGGFKITRKLFGKAPWHRKESVDSFSSVSSSIREILSGHTPPVTPISESKPLCEYIIIPNPGSPITDLQLLTSALELFDMPISRRCQ